MPPPELIYTVENYLLAWHVLREFYVSIVVRVRVQAQRALLAIQDQA